MQLSGVKPYNKKSSNEKVITKNKKSSKPKSSVRKTSYTRRGF